MVAWRGCGDYGGNPTSKQQDDSRARQAVFREDGHKHGADRWEQQGLLRMQHTGRPNSCKGRQMHAPTSKQTMCVVCVGHTLVFK